MKIRRTAHFSGHVQGVNFRFTARQLARGFQVTGEVRNLADGRVELVAEGTSGELDRFVEAIQTRMRSHIAEVSTSESPAQGTFDGFEIAF